MEENDILQGTVEGVGGNGLDGLDDLHAVDDMTEDGVGAIEVRCSAFSEVGLPHVVGHLDVVLRQ